MKDGELVLVGLDPKVVEFIRCDERQRVLAKLEELAECTGQRFTVEWVKQHAVPVLGSEDGVMPYMQGGEPEPQAAHNPSSPVGEAGARFEYRIVGWDDGDGMADELERMDHYPSKAELRGCRELRAASPAFDHIAVERRRVAGAWERVAGSEVDGAES